MSKFKKELKKQARLAIAAAVGFIIAYAWRNTILRIAEFLFHGIEFLTPTTSDLLFAFLLTLIGVILILISSRLLE